MQRPGNRLISHKDDTGNESTWAFDALDRPVTMTYPDTSEVTYAYDDADNVVEVVDAAGNEIDDTYDANNRRTARAVTRGTGVLGTTAESFAYDGLGRMTEASDNDCKVEFTYGTIGLSSQVYEEKQSYVGGTAYTKTVTKVHDANGNVVAETYPSGLDLDRTWNDIDRLATVTDGTNTIASYTYVGSRVKKVTFQNGTTASATFTGFRGEVSRIQHKTSAPATLLDLQYGYDENHDRLYERFGGSGSSGDAFAYDMARRLAGAWMGSSTPSSPSSAAYVKKIDYTLDDDGNRSSVSVTPYGMSATVTSYTANSLNQYTAIGGASPTHDGNGNLTDDGTQQYEYDYKNQIVRVKQSSTTIAEYKYDALGRRVEKDDQSAISRYIYSGAETVSVYDASTTWKQDFVFGQVIDEVLMLEQADVLDFDGDQNTGEVTRSFYHRNALGSVMEITDMNEAEVVSYRYDPYGAVTITVGGTPESSDPLGNPWMFTARFHDEETGLEYYRARYYATVTGRFLQRDPLGYDWGANLYAYCHSRPIGLTDPAGLSPEEPQPRSRGAVTLPEAIEHLRDLLNVVADLCKELGKCKEKTCSGTPFDADAAGALGASSENKFYSRRSCKEKLDSLGREGWESICEMDSKAPAARSESHEVCMKMTPFCTCKNATFSAKPKCEQIKDERLGRAHRGSGVIMYRIVVVCTLSGKCGL